MPKKIQTVSASTQRFTEIENIVEDVVLFFGEKACLTIEVFPTNFALLSTEEQDAKIGAFSSFLNSLTSPIQIIISNRRLDINSYASLLEQEIEKVHTPKVKAYMQQYKEFVKQMVKQNIVLDKKFYIIIPFSSFDVVATQTMIPGTKQKENNDFLTSATTALHTKASGIRTQLARINLKTRILEKDQLINLFHAMYDPEVIVKDSSENIEQKGEVK